MGWVWTGLEGACFSGYQLSLIPARPLPCCLQLLCLLYFPSHPASLRSDCDWLKHCMSLPVNWSNWLTSVNTVALFGLGDESCKYCYLPRCVINALLSHHWLFSSLFSECHACYHRNCFRAGKDCPRCQRLAERRERMARKNMEEQEDEGGGWTYGWQQKNLRD